MPTIGEDELLIKDLTVKLALAEKAAERAKKKLERRARLEMKGVSNPQVERSEIEEFGKALYDVIKYRLMLDDALEDAGKPDARRKKKPQK